MKFEKLRKAVESGIFKKTLMEIVPPPSREEIETKSQTLPVPMHREHVELLLAWGGSNLDEIRINSLDRIECDGQFVGFANDYDGYVYQYDVAGVVYSRDTDGGEILRLAASISEFIDDVFLGARSAQFYGHDWFDRLRQFGFV